MVNINTNFLNLKDNYLFSEISNRVSKYKEKNPNSRIISLGIGDVTLPISNVVIDAIKKSAEELKYKETFKGYGPEQGYTFLRDKISNKYQEIGIDISAEEIFVSDGAKSDIANITDIFATYNTVLIPSPVYPVYNDTNVLNDRKIEYLFANEENSFKPLPKDIKKNIIPDIIYLCSPNNPTGAVYNKEELEKWVEYANFNSSVILYDSAYSDYIVSKDIPKSIFEIENAKKCAIEFCSFSKNAGFTGIRCGYTIISKELEFDNINLNKIWKRRQTTKFNGVSYVVQRAAEATFTPDGKEYIDKCIKYYLSNTNEISKLLDKKNIKYVGGKNSPYIWLKIPNNQNSWDFFNKLLHYANVVGTPGIGFGINGEGYFRLTGFGNEENINEAIKRLDKIL